jgi:ribosomal-protein-alanine N-acetyltransferase
MESGFYHPDLDGAIGTLPGASVSADTTTDWRLWLPILTGDGITLRELQLSDAPSLLAMLTTDEVTRFISPPPTTVDGFERFIRWTHQQRAAGKSLVFGVVPAGMSTAVGLFQVKALAPDFSTAEWGFALGSPFWGTGLFVEAARLVLDFAFGTMEIHRLEARAAVQNGRGNGALRKLGAVREGVLRGSFLRHGQYHDQALWSILETDWWQARTLPGQLASATVH